MIAIIALGAGKPTRFPNRLTTLRRLATAAQSCL